MPRRWASRDRGSSSSSPCEGYTALEPSRHARDLAIGVGLAPRARVQPPRYGQIRIDPFAARRIVVEALHRVVPSFGWAPSTPNPGLSTAIWVPSARLASPKFWLRGPRKLSGSLPRVYRLASRLTRRAARSKEPAIRTALATNHWQMASISKSLSQVR
jgi:hypothetical protein